MEQLAPILNPREAPPEWYRESAAAGSAGGVSRSTGANGSITIEAVGGDAPLLQLLLDLNGIPEVRWTLSVFTLYFAATRGVGWYYFMNTAFIVHNTISHLFLYLGCVVDVEVP